MRTKAKHKIARLTRLSPMLKNALARLDRVEREVLEDEIVSGDPTGQLRQLGFTREAISRVSAVVEEFQPEGGPTSEH